MSTSSGQYGSRELIKERGFERDNTDADDLRDLAEGYEVDIAFTEGYVHVEGPRKEVQSMINPEFRGYVGREEPEMSDLRMGDASHYHSYAADGGKDTDSLQDAAEELDSKSGWSHTGTALGENMERPDAQGWFRRGTKF